MEAQLPSLKNVTVRFMLRKACWARNTSITYGGKTPIEIAFGRRPPDIMSIETMTAIQFVTDPTEQQKLSTVVQEEALKAHLEARQRMDIRRDLAQKLRPSDGPFHPGQSIWYWDRDLSKIHGGEFAILRADMVEAGFDEKRLETVDKLAGYQQQGSHESGGNPLGS